MDMGRGWRGEAVIIHLFVLGEPDSAEVRNLDTIKFRSQLYHLSPV